ncbi:MAG: DUF2019 domain-containing protein [Pseudomonadota bacterium]
MTSVDLSTLSIDQLLARFVELCLDDEQAHDLAKVSVSNRLVYEISDVKKELQKRPGDQRSALIALFKHPNLYVRYHVATNLMSVMPEEARRQMQAIADSKQYPIAGSAGTYLLMLDLAAKDAEASK